MSVPRCAAALASASFCSRSMRIRARPFSLNTRAVLATSPTSSPRSVPVMPMSYLPPASCCSSSTTARIGLAMPYWPTAKPNASPNTTLPTARIMRSSDAEAIFLLRSLVVFHDPLVKPVRHRADGDLQRLRRGVALHRHVPQSCRRLRHLRGFGVVDRLKRLLHLRLISGKRRSDGRQQCLRLLVRGLAHLGKTLLELLHLLINQRACSQPVFVARIESAAKLGAVHGHHVVVGTGSQQGPLRRPRHGVGPLAHRMQRTDAEPRHDSRDQRQHTNDCQYFREHTEIRQKRHQGTSLPAA